MEFKGTAPIFVNGIPCIPVKAPVWLLMEINEREYMDLIHQIHASKG